MSATSWFDVALCISWLSGMEISLRFWNNPSFSINTAVWRVVAIDPKGVVLNLYPLIGVLDLRLPAWLERTNRIHTHHGQQKQQCRSSYFLHQNPHQTLTRSKN